MYTIRRSVDIHFAHHVRGHLGRCINIHGHTWKFEVDLCSEKLNNEGFVADFGDLSARVLQPCYSLLDHALAMGEQTLNDIEDDLARVGEKLLASQHVIHGDTISKITHETQHLAGAYTKYVGGMKVAVFPKSPTSERLAKWLFELSTGAFKDTPVKTACGRVYESLHPVHSVAEYHE